MARRTGSLPSARLRHVGAADVWAAAISVVGLQIHAVIEARNLLGVAVEEERGAALGEEPALSDPPLSRLAPTRMVNGRVDVGVKAVLAGVCQVPRRWR